ncbi:zinc finger protein 691-like isoform X2 [Aedes albopictus]|uniref:C2h2-type zn-finger protein n=1 Tax=Aedes albopictus TaxID=7160 RepID=A0ABM1Y5J7_AEDAL
MHTRSSKCTKRQQVLTKKGCFNNSKTMTSTTIKSEPEHHGTPSKVCRLCLNDDSPLVNVFAKEHLHRWISDFLSIAISTSDRMSQSICAGCQKYLTEFEEFWRSCHEVQGILQSLLEGENDEAGAGLSVQPSHAPKELEQGARRGNSPATCKNPDNCTEIQQKTKTNSLALFEIKAEPYDESYFMTGTEETSEPKKFEQDADQAQSSPMDDDMIETHDVKIEIHSDSEEASEEELLEEYQSSGSSIVYKKKKKRRKNTFICGKCQKRCTNKEHLHQHDVFVHNPKSHKCHPCELGFVHKINLIKHERSQKHLKRVRALKLPKNYKKNLHDDHETTHNEAPIVKNPDADHHITPGVVVPDTNGNASNDKPTQAKAATDSDPQWECDICHKSYSSYVNLYHHKRTHLAPKYFCPICGKPFLKRVLMKRHIHTHEIKPKQKPAPRRKLDDENADKPFECDICQKTFQLKSTLHNHKRKVHAPLAFACRICDIMFKTRYHMERHARCHNRM